MPDDGCESGKAVYRPRRHRYAVFYARGDKGDGKIPFAGGSKGDGKSDTFIQHLSLISPSRSRAHREGGRTSQIHELGRRHTYRQRRISGFFPFQNEKGDGRGNDLQQHYRRLETHVYSAKGYADSKGVGLGYMYGV